MERIKQVLQRAPQAASRVADAPQSEEQIVYSQTRVVALSPDHLAACRILDGTGTDQATVAYKVLRTQVLQRLALNGWNNIAVTSAGPGQGKTVTAINLAISLAAKVDHTVLLVDLDLRRPSVHRYLGLVPSLGIGDYLKNRAILSETLINPGIKRLVILPGKETMAGSSELLASPKMTHLITELKTRYASRVIIFDLPPLLAGDDALVIAPHVDAILMVVDEGRTTVEELERAKLLVPPQKLIGSVLNRSKDEVSSYAY